MKKVQTKNKLKGFFGLFAAFAMAIGVGVSLAPKEILKTQGAAGDVAAVADFTKKTAGSSSYDSTWTYGDWTLFGAANNNKTWAFMKFGGKNTTISSNNPVYARGQIKNVGISSVDVVFNAGNLTAGSVNSWGLKAYSDSNYSVQIASALGGTMAVKPTGGQTLTLTPSSAIPANSYYEVYFDLKNTTGTNGIVWVDKIQFIEASGAQGPDLESISLDVESLSLDILDTHQLLPSFEPDGASAGVSYSVTQSDPAGAASVSAGGLITALKTGTAIVTATTTDGSNLSATVNVTVTANYSSNIMTPAEAQELAVGADVLVRGKVVADIKNAGSYAIQVGDRGIMTYGINDLTVGHDYIIAAKMAAYQAMPQISNASSIIDMGPSTTTVTPKVITDVSELNAKLSGTLVQINNLKYKSGTFDTSDASNVTLTLGSSDLILRATKDVENSVINAANAVFSSAGPDDVLNITTVSGWFNGAQLLFSGETVIQKIVPEFGTLDRISLNTTNVVTSYYVGETFSLEGLVVTAYDETNLAKIVTDEATSSLAGGYTFVEGDIGNKTITISYIEGVTKTATFGITVQEAPSWRKVTLAFSGSSNVNLANDTNHATTLGLDSTIFNVQATKGSGNVPAANSTAKNIRLYFHASGGNILTVSVPSPKKIGKVVFNFDTTVAKAKIIVGGVEKYNDTPTASSALTFENFEATSFSIQNVNTTNVQLHIKSIDIYYEDPIYTEAKVFADWMMDTARDAEECEVKFVEAWGMWDELSQEAKELFKTHVDFEDAHARFLNWAIANDLVEVLDSDGSVAQKTVSRVTDNSLTATVIIGVIGLTTLAGYYFLQKKKEA